jgi:hypothetical protein
MRCYPAAAVLVTAAATLSLMGSSPGCPEDTPPCGRAPAGEVAVFLAGGDTASVFTGALQEAGPVAESGFRTYRFRESGGAEHVLSYRSPEGPLPLQVGGTYEVRVETVPGTPTPSALVVQDADGLLVVAASDYRPGDRVLTSGVDGFLIALDPSECGDRAADPCLESEVNGLLRVEHADSTIRLFQGDIGTVHGFRVRCLTARFVTYSSTCADAGVFGVSYIVERVSTGQP